MKKKLVQINVVCSGSTGRIMNQIQKEAIERGWEAYSFFGRGKPSNKDCYRIGNKFDIIINIILTRIFDLHGYGSRRSTKKLVKRIQKIDPDVIQLHNIHGYYINIKILFDYLKKCNKKIVWTLHDCWAFTGHCAYFSMAQCEKWKLDCNYCPQKNNYPRSILFRNSKFNYIKKKESFTGVKNLIIVTPSKWLSGLVKKSFLQDYAVKVINNGIDTTIFRPTNSINLYEKYNIPLDKRIILGVAANWEERKGYKDFIELSKNIESNFCVVMVGLNKKEIKKLKGLNIIGIEKTENVEELASLYTAADVFVNLTYEDNYPTTNLESLACGTPVVTYDTGGSVESINKHNGRIVKKGDISSLIRAIKESSKLKGSIIHDEIDGKVLYQNYIKIYEE